MWKKGWGIYVLILFGNFYSDTFDFLSIKLTSDWQNYAF